MANPKLGGWVLSCVLAFFLGAVSIAGADEASQAAGATTQPVYHIYAGNTHSHTQFTWSHGDQWEKPKPGADGKKVKAIEVDPEGSQGPSPSLVLKSDWQKFQGPPSAHFALAKANGYDFYVVSDHSQEKGLQPPEAKNPEWVASNQQAQVATDADFVAIRGYEHSENNGPGGVGHLNVINSDSYLNALMPGIDLPYLYNWLKTAKPDGDGPVVASFNHPGPQQYNDWAYRDPQITEIITMLEVINSNNKIHYAAFVQALDKGWKVSPCCGNDNHGLWGITHHTSRTFVLATAKTKAAILDAMKHRRTYAALDKNIQCQYTVNGQIMGSTLDKPEDLQFDIHVSDPDTDNPKDKITKLDIVKDGGAVAETFTPQTPAHTVHWKPTIHDATSHYFFIRVWNAGGGDAPNADPQKPIAWLAPVWTGR
ncbi:MAG TPA: CehA/McbA family metallohydrolase [Tepidisphaeraceae bacterium]|nr:CehA/McbA family metallohydrolase [Tepidisphaeraceae bacterium]